MDTHGKLLTVVKLLQWNLLRILKGRYKFSEQVKWADVIYIRGGQSEARALELLRKESDWINNLGEKTLVGTSAGADIVSKYYYDLDNLKVSEGLGLLPIKVITHYKSDYNVPNIDWDKAYTQLKNSGADLPILTLAEGQFVVRSSLI